MPTKTRRTAASRSGRRPLLPLLFGMLGVAAVLGAVFLPQPGSAPGAASGTAQAAGVQVRGAQVALGVVPLNQTVKPTWTLTNTSDQGVTLGRAHAQVNAGCCPGPLRYSAQDLAPGASATLTFPLRMHPGMDGWHDFTVHVPVVGADGISQTLPLQVTGDFRDGAHAG